MKPFFFCGPIPASKSVMIRWLVADAYGGPLTIRGNSDCDDVRLARAALKALDRGETLDVGEGAFGFRALAMCASRRPGQHRFRLSERLAARPHGPLISLLRALGVSVHHDGIHWSLRGEGWQVPAEPLAVDGSLSSQFASALLLNSWNLPAPLHFHADLAISGGYFDLTRRQVATLGLSLAGSAKEGWRIPAGISVPAMTVDAEADMSSAFAVAALAAVAGEAHLEGVFPEASTQPDACFPAVLRRLGVSVVATAAGLTVRRHGPLQPVELDLGGAPDLFPVLAALAATARGTSRLFGAPHLRAKESDRIRAVQNLLTQAGVSTEALPDGLVVHGPVSPSGTSFRFHPEHDHRLVMAAAVLRAAGLPIEIAGTAVVAKSFPEFAELLVRSELV